MHNRVIVSAIIEKDGTYLMGKKPKGKGPYPDTWHLLGGGMNLGQESSDDAVKREIWEEAGIKITNLKRVFFNDDMAKDKNGDDIHYVFLIYSAEYESGDPRPMDDIAQLKWFRKDEIKNIALNPPSVLLFQELGWL
jgi:ADP-ribose pyrophosphatase YjhB (NUDIX family)